MNNTASFPDKAEKIYFEICETTFYCPVISPEPEALYSLNQSEQCRLVQIRKQPPKKQYIYVFVCNDFFIFCYTSYFSFTIYN